MGVKEKIERTIKHLLTIHQDLLTTSKTNQTWRVNDIVIRLSDVEPKGNAALVS